MAYADTRMPELVPDRLETPMAFVIRWIPLAIVAILWEVASGWVVAEAVLPGPMAVFAETWEVLITGTAIPHLFISAVRVLLGLFLSIVVGVMLGIGIARSDPVEDFFDVFLSLLYPIPKSALVPLAILWLGIGTKTAVFVVFLACLLPIVLNSYNAAASVDRNLLWSARMMGTSGRELLYKIVVPATVPEIITGIRQAIPIAFIALVSAELIASNRGIGHLILSSGQVGNYPSMFAAILLISLVAYVAVRGFEYLEREAIAWT